MARILIIEDEKMLSRFVQLELEHEGYETDVANDGLSGLDKALRDEYDLMLLDLMLPGMSGIEICRRVRQHSKKPIIMLTAKDDVSDKVMGLDMGADDYINKPFSASELLARIRVALRQADKIAASSASPEMSYTVGDLTVDFQNSRVYIAREEVHLTRLEYRIVELLARTPGKVLTHDYIISSVWGPYAPSNNNLILRVNIANIRRKIEKNHNTPRYILAEIGVGYRMADAESLSGPKEKMDS